MAAFFLLCTNSSLYSSIHLRFYVEVLILYIQPPPPIFALSKILYLSTIFCFYHSIFLFLILYRSIYTSTRKAQGYKTFFMLNTTEHQISTAHKN